MSGSTTGEALDMVEVPVVVPNMQPELMRQVMALQGHNVSQNQVQNLGSALQNPQEVGFWVLRQLPGGAATGEGQAVAFDLQVITLAGKTITCRVQPRDTVGYVKALIQAEEGVPREQQHLTHGLTMLTNDNTIEHYGITAESTLHLVLCARGGQEVGCLAQQALDVSKSLIQALLEMAAPDHFED